MRGSAAVRARLLRSEVRAAAVKLLAIQSRRALKEEQRKNSAELATDADKAARLQKTLLAE